MKKIGSGCCCVMMFLISLVIAILGPNLYESIRHDVSLYDAVFVESWKKRAAE